MLEDRTLLSMITVTNTNDTGAGSLRQAILDANANDGPDTIVFNIPPSDSGFVDVDSALPGGDAAADAFVIQPLSALPALSDATGGTTIDGQTQSAFGGDTNPFGPEIVIDGSSAAGDGVQIHSDNNVVVGLNIQQFSGRGITVIGGNDNWIAANYVGTDATGTVGQGNGTFGVDVRGGAQLNVIGTNGDGADDALEGNIISGNGLRGIEMTGVGTNFNVISGNFIGTDATGTTEIGNGSSGIAIGFGAQFNRVGTNGNGVSDEFERNVISGNAGFGVSIVNNNDLGTANNTVAGNYIGTDVTGTVALGNGNQGVNIRLGAQNNLIGTNGDGVADDAERNVISGNNSLGVGITGDGTNGNVIAGNFIGTDVTGTVALGNLGRGIQISNGARFNVIGTNGDGFGDTAERNVISDNLTGVLILGAGADQNVIAGNFIGTDVTGTVPLGNHFTGVWVADFGSGTGSQNRIGTNGDGIADAVERNVISGNTIHGVGITAASHGNVVAGNYIGTDVTGTVAMGNSQYGVSITSGAQSNRIGTDGDGLADAAEGNLISGNSVFGIRIQGIGTDQNVVAGNLIGTDVTGTTAIGNGADGVLIHGGAQFNLIGTDGDGVADAAERNIISGNSLRGVLIGFDDGNDQNVIAGNFIGTDVTGTVALGNGLPGIHISGVNDSNRIGTDGDGIADAAERNVISGNLHDGVNIGEATNTIVAGNFIGTDVTGTVALGNLFNGVRITTGAQSNVIGTDGDGVADAAERNVISANGNDGVLITDANTDNNVVAGNLIGTDVTGTAPLGNGGADDVRNGIQIWNGAEDNRIGTDGNGIADVAEANTIAFNIGAGVKVIDASTGNSIRGNSIHSNGGLGIDLGGDGVTANDTGDPDAGPNNVQNFPVLTLAEAGPSTHVVGSLSSTPNTTFTIDVYASSVADPSGHGEGERYLGSFTVTTDASGNVIIDELIAVPTIAGEAIAATATDPAGNTSEFSEVALALETFDSVMAMINDLLTEGSLNEGQVNSLASQLEKAADKLESGKSKVAENKLNAMINHIQSLIDEGVLALEEGQPLIDAVNHLLIQMNEDNDESVVF